VLLLLLAAIVGGPAAAAERDLAAYLALATRYGSGQRIEALGELRTWGPSEFDAAIQRRENRLRSRAALKDEIDFGNVESAVLLHAEAGLLALALRSDSGVDPDRHLRASVTLYEWSRGAASRLQKRASLRGERPDLLRFQERLAPRDYYATLAATSLAFGFPLTARPFAQEAVRSAPLDAEAHLISGCAAESLAETFALRQQDSDAERSRDDAGRDLRDALAIDPGLVEARLRLGHLLLRQRRAVEAESLLTAVDEGSADDRQRYLARLFLGRVADRRGRREEAAGWYRRAVETWPDSQAARLGLAQLLETSCGPAAAVELVGDTLAASRRQDRLADPWWDYPFGPPGLSRTLLERVWGQVIGR
jgi:tetratricopeptide (TPR) repeat protein